MSITTIKEGDHLLVNIAWSGGLIQHHGIYVGSGNVIHFKKHRDATNIFKFLFPDVVIDKTPIGVFDEGRERYIIKYDSAICFPPDEVVKGAEYLFWLQREGIRLQGKDKQLEEHIKKIRYNLTEFNCEHFASYCKTGRKISLQAENGVYLAREVMGTVEVSAPSLLAEMENFSFSDD